MGMELFLNLCWLALLLPAYLLWRQKTRSRRSPNVSFAFICTLGCLLVLLFPVISASDDLQAMRPEAEESERAFRDAGDRGFSQHQPTHSSHCPQPALITSAAPALSVHQSDTVSPAPPVVLASAPSSASLCRPPPFVA